MSIRIVLRNFIRVVSDEAERNPEFAEQLRNVLQPAAGTRPPARSYSANKTRSVGRPANRRPQAIVDPISLAVQGEDVLRGELGTLSLDQLKDIVADYGMDQQKLVMKWKTSNRVMERIVEISMSRAHKGNAFRS